MRRSVLVLLGGTVALVMASTSPANATLPVGLPFDGHPGTPATPAAADVGVAADIATYTGRRVERFKPGWWSGWGLDEPWNATVRAEGTNPFLRVRIGMLSHIGTSFLLPVPDADFAHVRYRLRLGPTFDALFAAHDVKLPGFGAPAFDELGSCLAACGGAHADGVTAYSARVHITSDGKPGSYVYDLDRPDHDFGRGERWDAGRLERNRWYVVDQYIRMNTPGAADGSLVAYLDGQKVFEDNGMSFRSSSELRVGNVWFDVYYGGAGRAPFEMRVDVDDMLIEWA